MRGGEAVPGRSWGAAPCRVGPWGDTTPDSACDADLVRSTASTRVSTIITIVKHEATFAYRSPEASGVGRVDACVSMAFFIPGRRGTS